MGPFERIIGLGGYAAALKGLNVRWKPFRETAKVDIGMPFGAIDLARDAVEADAIINLAKLKSHSQMFLTLGVKNMFGCVVGLMKPEWHLRAGINRDKFARLLVQICQTLAPALTMVDGIVALEGQGPGKSGTPRTLGMLVGGRSPFAVDKAICKVLGIPPERLATNRAAADLGLNEETLYIAGDFHIVYDFDLPELGPLTSGPGFFQRMARKHLLQKPVVDDRLCGVCSKCWQYCPTRAILRDQHKVRFDYDRCIRCYCCQEVCPEGAIRTIEPLAGKLLRKIVKQL
jgi:Pyruvate/2-oxoacid:ferredoxin oxidoreductase delta subunit